MARPTRPERLRRFLDSLPDEARARLYARLTPRIEALEGDRLAEPEARLSPVEAERLGARAARADEAFHTPDLIDSLKRLGALLRDMRLAEGGAGPAAARIGQVRAEAAERIAARLHDLGARAGRLLGPADAADAAAAARLFEDVGLLAALRADAAELGASELVDRLWAELGELLRSRLPVMIDELRAERGPPHAVKLARVEVALRLAAAVFGRSYAGLLARTVEIALGPAPRRPA